jgi:predicted small metal-binding protein
LLKRFVCDRVIPGCDGVFTGAADQEVLDQVLAHVATVHGMGTPALSFIELVMTHTRPFTPTRRAGHLRVVAADDPDDRSDAGDGRDAGGRFIRAVGAATSGVAVPGAVGMGVGRVLPENVHPLRRLAVDGLRPGAAHETFRHECLLYDGSAGFLAAVVPFVRAGLARQEPTMVAVAQPRLRAVRSALGRDADRVVFADMADLGHNPARIIPAWREFTTRFSGPGRPIRGVGEPIWATRHPAEVVEAQLHEALLNVAVTADTPLWLLCPYDTATLDEHALIEAHRSHPVIVESDTYRDSTEYGGAAHVDHLFRAALPDPVAPGTVIIYDPHRHRHVDQISRSASAAGLTADRAVKLAAAVDEIALAGHRETGRVDILLWREESTLICQVTDPGTVHDPLIGRSAPVVPGGGRDRAIRLANELCDLTQVRASAAGTTVRVHSVL